jgi:hypothetical protein
MSETTNNTTFVEIEPEYVYLTIPAEWVCVYHKLLSYMADFGKTIVDDCTALCQGNGKNVVSCWNIFQAAVSARALGRTAEADFFIKYVKKQLELIYKGSDLEVYHNTVPLAVTDDGKLKAVVSCNNDTHFYVTPEDGILYQEWLNSKDKNVYSLNENDLIVEDTSK